MQRVQKYALAAAGATLTAIAVQRLVRRLRPARFDDQVVFITGGSRGLGFALAREFGLRGARVAIVARHEDELRTASERLWGENIEAWSTVCDVRDQRSARHAIRLCEREVGPIDVLINNAGIITVGPAESMTRDDYVNALDTHFWGSYNTTEAVLPSMRLRGRGRIVNVSSVGGRLSVPHLLPYSVSKFALVGYSEGLRSELARSNITVTTVCPGLMRTGSPRNAWFKGDHKAEYTWFMLSDTLPGLSVAATTAAREIADATAAGRASLDISLPAKMASVVHTLAPATTSATLELAARLLPKKTEPRQVPGAASETGVTRSPLTVLGRKAEADFNQR